MCTWNLGKNTLHIQDGNIWPKRSLSFWNGLKTKREKWLLIGSTYANARSWDILQRRKGPSHLTESIKTLNGKSCSPEVITTIIGSFICAGLSWKRFLCSRAGEKGGLGGDLWVNLCTRLLPNIGIPTQWWWWCCGDKSPQPLETLTFQPGRFIASDPLWSLPVAHRLPWIVCLFDPLRVYF